VKTSSILVLGATLLLMGCQGTNDPTVNASGYKTDMNPFDVSTDEYKGFKAAFHGFDCDKDSEEFKEGCERFHEDKQG